MESAGESVCIVSNRLSVIANCRRHKLCSKLLKRASTYSVDFSAVNLKNTSGYLSGRLSYSDSCVLYASVHSFITENVQCGDLFMMWNGSCTIGACVKGMKAEIGYSTLFSEISNLPGKLVVDPAGVNAQSSIYENERLICGAYSVTVSAEEYNRWYLTYKAFKREIPPQAVKQRHISPWVLLDFLGFIGACPCDDSRGVISFIARKLHVNVRRVKVGGTYISPDILRKRYYFAPLQVSDDSQLLVNSEYDNFDLIDCALEQARETQRMVYVKIHPAETSRKFIEKLKERYEREPLVKYVEGSSFELLEFADKVFVINSTMGLEALLLKKDVVILGRAFYESFDFDKLKKYIFGYLFDIDYFSNDPVSVELVKKAFSRATLFSNC